MRSDFTALRHILDDDQVASDRESLVRYSNDYSQQNGEASLVVFPKHTQDVKRIVDIANRSHLPLVPSGGRTGLSGGSVASKGEVVISFDRMNTVVSLDASAKRICCQAGVITQDIQAWATDNNLYYPIEFAAQGSSQIGGNVATNAGGIRAVKYGMTRNWVSGLTVVIGSGEIVRLERRLLKDNTGYDLLNLLVGSEGTLAIVTEVELCLTDPPPPLVSVLLALPSIEDLQTFVSRLCSNLDVYAAEAIGRSTWDAYTLAKGHQDYLDLADEQCLLLIEFPENNPDVELCASLAQGCGVVRSLVAKSAAQRKSIWSIRDGLSGFLHPQQPLKFDISVPLNAISDFLCGVEKILKNSCIGCVAHWFGHCADGNIHLNIVRHFNDANEHVDMPLLQQTIYQWVIDCGGSISAEHGIGNRKINALQQAKSGIELQLMRKIKNQFDPNGILNPGKLIC